MVRADIVSGLKNAVERGYSLEQAKQTFINANYNPQEVDEAVAYLSGGLKDTQLEYSPESQAQTQQAINQTGTEQQIQQFQQQNQKTQQLPQTQTATKTKKKSNVGFIILLVGFLLILIGAIVALLFFKDQIVDFLKNLTGK